LVQQTVRAALYKPFQPENIDIGQPCDFQTPPDLRSIIDATLAPGAPKAKRKYLVNIGVGKPTHKQKHGIPLPVSEKSIKNSELSGSSTKLQSKDDSLTIHP
jgi:hypothetical protein